MVEETIPTKKLYDEDAYCREFRARVLSCKRLSDGSQNLILDQSAFFPEAGGQSCDPGWVWQEGASPHPGMRERLHPGMRRMLHLGTRSRLHLGTKDRWHREVRNRSHLGAKDRCSRRVRKSLPNWTLRFAMTRCSSIRENIFFPVW